MCCMTGEVMVGPKKVFLLDEPTTGLDSSTAHHIVKTIRDFAHMEGVRRYTLACYCQDHHQQS